MGKRKTNSSVSVSPFTREYEFQLGQFTIVRGDIIKIEGEHGVKFKFDAIVTDPRTGSMWVDCFELEKGLVSRYLFCYRQDQEDPEEEEACQQRMTLLNI